MLCKLGNIEKGKLLFVSLFFRDWHFCGRKFVNVLFFTLRLISHDSPELFCYIPQDIFVMGAQNVFLRSMGN